MAKRQKNRQDNGQKTEGQTRQLTKDRRTDKTMAKRQKDRQDNEQKTEGQTRQWPKDRRTDKTMNKRQKDRQDNGQKIKYKRTDNDLQNIHIKLKIE
jgi:hypothetical protein